LIKIKKIDLNFENSNKFQNYKNMSSRTIDFSKAKDIIEKNSMKLIWNEEEFGKKYQGIKTKISIICSCSRKKEMTIVNIRNGSTCRECADERNRDLQKKNRTSFKTALEISTKNSFKLKWNESEYDEKFIGMTKPIPVICCNCEKESFKTLTNIKTGTKCKHCVIPKTRLLQYEKVNQIFTENGMKLLWNEKEFNDNFIGCNQKIPVMCVCNEKKELHYTNVRQGRKCQDCGNNRKKIYKEVVEIVESKNMKLLMNEIEFNEIYKNMNSPMKLICKCNREYLVRINDVKNGISCKECGYEKIKNTCLERYGVTTAILSYEIQQKIKNTCLERYGVENPFSSYEIQQKIKNTCLVRYGVENPFSSYEIQQKIKNTCLERYGVENPFLSYEIQQKIKNTCLVRYGVENPFLSYEIQQKIKNTCLERYGVENPFLSYEIQQKIKNTCLERYGVENPFLSYEIQQKIKNACLEKYGVYCISQNKEIRIKIQNTCLERYGVMVPAQNEEIRLKMQNTCLERYGVRFALQNEEIFSKAMTKMTSFKEFILPSGKKIEIQGYEAFALKELLEEGIKEDDIVTGSTNVPVIWYLDGENKKRRHYVDIYIKSQNKCIEVKSEWTLKLQENFMSYKQDKAKNDGYEYEIWVYNHKAEKLRILL